MRRDASWRDPPFAYGYDAYDGFYHIMRGPPPSPPPPPPHIMMFFVAFVIQKLKARTPEFGLSFCTVQAWQMAAEGGGSWQRCGGARGNLRLIRNQPIPTCPDFSVRCLLFFSAETCTCSLRPPTETELCAFQTRQASGLHQASGLRTKDGCHGRICNANTKA
jgi:hypothetical protein